ncbi:MAG: RIP metalloprotease RseP [Clostridiaceae bacterium]|jgi:regulator of sigma E protease|nr:RIP metalloprotease RseP [Clostridiaceae bacterium]
MNILWAIIALSFLILIHELGHFVVARWADIKVLEFSIFMGPKLFSWGKGETKYSIRAIPMGGFVRMEGEEEDSDDERAFNKKPAWKRALVVAAGATMNIVIAIIIMTVISFSLGYNTNTISMMSEDSALKEAGLMVGDKIVSYDKKHVFYPSDLSLFLYVSEGEPVEVSYRREGVKGVQQTTVTPKETAPVYLIGVSVGMTDGKANNIIQGVEKGSPADMAGLIAGDVIIRVDDVTVSQRDDLLNHLQQTKDQPVEITVDRNGDIITVHDVVPVASQTYFDLGVQYEYKKGGFWGAITSGINYSISTMRSVFYSIGWLFTGKANFSDLSGPVGIVSYIGEVVDMGRGLSEKILYLMQISAFLSLNLGVMNLLPFPALDGGKLFLILIEKIRKKPIPPEKEAWISLVGFALLIALMIATLFNDIPKLFRGF